MLARRGVAIAVIALATSVGQAAAQTPSQPPPTVDRTEQALLPIIKSAWPAEYDALVGAIASGDQDAASQVVIRLLDKFAPRVAYAGLAELEALSAATRAITDTLRRVDPQRCGGFGHVTPQGSIIAFRENPALLNDFSVAMFGAMASGVHSTELRAATPADLHALQDAVHSMGVTDGELAATAAADATSRLPSGRVCEIWLALDTAAGSLPPDVRHRLLASLYAGPSHIDITATQAPHPTPPSGRTAQSPPPSDYDTLFAIMKAEWPDEYQAMLAAGVIGSQDASSTVLARLLDKYAPRIAYAGLAELDEMLAAGMAMSETLRRIGPQYCGRLYDATELLRSEAPRLTSRASLAGIAVMASGMHGTERREATREDGYAYLAAIHGMGVTDSELAMLREKDVRERLSPDRLCEISIILDAAVASLSPDVRHRLLASRFSG
jgi:hypothetical protein